MNMTGWVGCAACLGLAWGCGPTVEGADESTAGAGATSGAGSTAGEDAEGTSVASATEDADDGDTGATVGPGEGSSGGDTSGGEASSDDGSREEVCFFEQIVCDAASCEDPNVISCGFVNWIDHTVEEWTATHECVLQAVADEMPFVAGFSPEPPDGMGTIDTGYIGLAGVVYGTAAISFHANTYELDTATMRSCASIAAQPGCTIETISDGCLACIDPGEVGSLCEP